MTIDAIAKVVQAADAAFNEGSHVTLEEAKRLIELVRNPPEYDMYCGEFCRHWQNFPKWEDTTIQQKTRLRNFLCLAQNMLAMEYEPRMIEDTRDVPNCPPSREHV